MLTAFDTDFAVAMSAAGLDHNTAFLSALSGGADSTALSLLMARYAVANGKRHRALIVDHGIRADAGAEAGRVAARMHNYGIDVTVEKVSEKAPRTGLQAWARRHRFDIMLAHARRENAALLLGHHAGDQGETIAMRLGKTSGFAGLAGMSRMSWRAGVMIGRPMLDWPATRMVEACRQMDCAFENDPSNQDRRFERIRWRQFMMQANEYGGMLCRLGDAAARILGVLDDALAPVVVRDIILHEAGYAILPKYQAAKNIKNASSLANLADSAWNRVMGRLLHQVGGQTYAPSKGALHRLKERMQRGQRATLSGCMITPTTAGDYMVLRELGRQVDAVSIAAGEDIIFGGCWHVKSRATGKLMAFGHSMAARTPSKAALPPAWDTFQHIVRRTIPVMQSLDGRVFYPQVKSCYDDKAAPATLLDACFLPLIAGNPVNQLKL